MTAALFSSCLKDVPRAPIFTNDGPVVDFATVVNLGTVQTATLPLANATNTINTVIALAGQHDYTTPTTVTVIVDPSVIPAAPVAVPPAVQTVNALLPASAYTITSLTPSGNPGIQQRIENIQPIVGTPLPLPNASEAMISATVNTAAVQALMLANPNTTYYLPMTITGASGNGAVVDQWHSIAYKIVLK